MLALITTDSLVLADSATLKHPPSSIPITHTLPSRCTASSWSQDNTHIFLSDGNYVYKYSPSGNQLQQIYTAKSEDPIHCLVAKDKGNAIIIGSAKNVHTLEFGSGLGKIIQTFDSQKSPVTALSLSNDCTLLASASSSAVHVHNLTLSSHTILRGVPSGTPIKACAFHPHTRTRLLVGVKRQMLVYDTTRPSNPIKSVQLGGTPSEEIVAIACSPFSKTLVAVATSGGDVGLIDLDREKGLIKLFNLKVPLTTLAFTPEGAALYVGTESGKLLIVDLRALEKPPKSILVGQNGSRIETMSVQKKLKDLINETKAQTSTGKTAVGTTITPLPNSNSNDTAGRRAAASAKLKAMSASPGRVRSKIGSLGAGVKSPVRVALAAKLKGDIGNGTPRKGATRKPTGPGEKKVFSPVRDPLVNSGNVASEDDDLSVHFDGLAVLRARTTSGSVVSRKENLKAGAHNQEVTLDNKAEALTNRLPSSSSLNQMKGTISSSRGSTRANSGKRTTTPTLPSAGITKGEEREYLAIPGRKAESISAHFGTLKSQASNGSIATSIAGGRSRPVSVLSNISQGQGPSTMGTRWEHTDARPASCAASSISRAGSAHSASTYSRKGKGKVSDTDLNEDEQNRNTPSPDLPNDPVTPILASKKAANLGVLGLNTPGVEKWIRSGDYKGKKKEKPGRGVGFAGRVGDEDGSAEEAEESDAESLEGESPDMERERELSMQISPRKPSPIAPTVVPSPLRGTVPAHSAHDMLRTIVRDVIYDFQREHKTEMMGLHLDLVRMGRGLRNELRGMTEEWGGELQQLREENAKLREENERLRRGY